MAKTADELVAMIGSPPTAQGVAAAIIAFSTPDAAPLDPPADHGLDPADPAVTGIPRDETTPTPGVDLPPTDTSPAPVETLAPDPAPPSTPTGGTGDDAVAPSPPEAAPPVSGDSPAVAADRLAVAGDEAKLAADQAQLTADEAAGS